MGGGHRRWFWDQALRTGSPPKGRRDLEHGWETSASVPASSSPPAHECTGPCGWTSPRAFCVGGRSCDSDPSFVLTLAYTTMKHWKDGRSVCHGLTSRTFSRTLSPSKDPETQQKDSRVVWTVVCLSVNYFVSVGSAEQCCVTGVRGVGSLEQVWVECAWRTRCA